MEKRGPTHCRGPAWLGSSGPLTGGRAPDVGARRHREVVVEKHSRVSDPRHLAFDASGRSGDTIGERHSWMSPLRRNSTFWADRTVLCVNFLLSSSPQYPCGIHDRCSQQARDENRGPALAPGPSRDASGGIGRRQPDAAAAPVRCGRGAAHPENRTGRPAKHVLVTRCTSKGTNCTTRAPTGSAGVARSSGAGGGIRGAARPVRGAGASAWPQIPNV